MKNKSYFFTYIIFSIQLCFSSADNIILRPCNTTRIIPEHRVVPQKSFLRFINPSPPPQHYLEQHGYIIAYFKHKTQNKYQPMNGSGFLHSNGLVTTAAHIFTVCLHETDSEEEMNEMKEFLEHYEAFCCKIHFYTQSGIRYDVASYIINPLYFSNEVIKIQQSDKMTNVGQYKQGDIALLFLTPLQSLSLTQPATLTFVEQNMTLQMHGYTMSQISDQEIEVQEHHRESQDVRQRGIFTSMQVSSFKGMSGAHTFVLNDERCSLVSINTSGNCDDPYSLTHVSNIFWNNCMSSGITLFNHAMNDFHAWQHLLFKREQFEEIRTQSIDDTQINHWRPVLFSIQTDLDVPFQDLILKKLTEHLKTKIKENHIPYLHTLFPHLFHYFTFSGLGENLQLEGTSISEANAIRESYNHDHRVPFPTERCQDLTLRGVDELVKLYPNKPGLVLSLGIGLNSEECHSLVTRRLRKRGLYERIDYLPYENESQESFTNRIDNTAKRLAGVIFRNYTVSDHFQSSLSSSNVR